MISGTAGGLHLRPVPGRDTRPTLDRVRESVFAILTPRIAEAKVLDLYAGTGALGIEALSRGAQSCVFVESQPQALAVLKDNLQHTHLTQRAAVLRLELPEGLRHLGARDPFDLVLADPPYAFSQWPTLLDRVQVLLGPAAIIVCEHVRSVTIEPAGDLELIRRAAYGQTHVSFFRRGGD